MARPGGVQDGVLRAFTHQRLPSVASVHRTRPLPDEIGPCRLTCQRADRTLWVPRRPHPLGNEQQHLSGSGLDREPARQQRPPTQPWRRGHAPAPRRYGPVATGPLGIAPPRNTVPAPSRQAKGRYQVARTSVPTTQTNSSNKGYLPGGRRAFRRVTGDALNSADSG